MRIQHNIAAMSSYRNYTNNVSAVNKNLEKLSSGYKINRAGDDAAGLAISEKMRAQISGLEAASKNAKDGISLVKTAEGALTEVHDMLNRMVTLAQQSANGTYDNETDRFQLQKEMDQLKSEINRIADSSNFNGINLLDGSLSTTGTVASYQNVDMTAVADASPEKTPANGKYQLDLSQAEWVVKEIDDTGKAVADGSGKFTLTFGGSSGIKVEITNLNAGDKVSGKDITKFIYNAIQNGDNAGLSDKVASGDIKVSFKGTGAGKMGFDDDKNFTINGKKLSVANDNGVLTFTGVDSSELNTESLSTAVVLSGDTTGKISNPNVGTSGGNQGWDQGWKVLEEAVDSSSTAIGHASFNLADLKIKDGTTIKIGDQTYTFAVGSKSQFKDSANVVDLTDMEAMPDAKSNDWLKVIGRLTAAAKDNKMVSVTSASTTPTDLTDGADANLTKAPLSTVLLTEKLGGLDRDKYDVFGKAYDKNAAKPDASLTHDAKWKTADGISLVQVGDAKINGKALTLQIGDTSDSFNQLKVSINDCHTAAMGLDGVSIATQGDAQAAVDAIKSAINYVSDVRGTLGATQNRLDHTINNLSVMTENIQDAESTIRDTDIAEEMMSYTKNNILVQSAQAMLAQANQIPQGVLQLLG